jgi:ABC-type tungstate transport system substrate-binding protein
MSYWSDAFAEAWDKIVHGDPYMMHLIRVTIQVAVIPTSIATLVGLPLAVLIGIGRFRGRTIALSVANAGLGLPPVIVGLVFVLLTLPAHGPFGGSGLIFTLNGVYVVQTVLALPVIVALSSAAILAGSPGLLDQARAFGAGRVQLAALAIREARVGILAAVIAAVGSALSEVGAVVLAGGNIEGLDQTLASATLEQVQQANWVYALAIGIVLLGLIVLVSGALTVLQHRGTQASRLRGRA